MINSNKIETLDIVKITKIGIIYVLILILFYVITNDIIRFLLSVIIFTIGIFLFNIDIKLAFIYIFIAICCAFTESIFINFFSNTWKYNKPNLNIVNIPLWLIPMWGVAITLIVQLINILTNPEWQHYQNMLISKFI